MKMKNPNKDNKENKENKANKAIKTIALLLAAMLLLAACGGGNQAATTTAAATTAAATEATTAATTAAATEATTAAATEATTAATTAAATEATTAATTTTAATEAATTAQAATEPTAQEDGVEKTATIQLAISWSGGYEPGEQQQEVLDAITKSIYEQSGFTINFKIRSADFNDFGTKQPLWIATREVDMGSCNLNLLHLQSESLLAPISMDTIKKYAPVLVQYLNMPLINKFCLDDEGRIKMLMTNMNAADMDAVGNFVPWIRKDLLDQAGLGIPKTISEMETALKAFREIVPDIVGIDAEYASWLFDNMFIGLSYPAKQTDENGDLLPLWGYYYIKSPEFRDYIETMSRWFREGYFSDEVFIWDVNKHTENRNAGKTGIWYDGWWMQRSFDKLADLYPEYPRPEGVPYMNYVPFFPTSDDGRPLVYGYAPANYSAYGWEIFQWANKEACLAFINWGMASAENAILARFGLEGKQWVMKDNALASIPEAENSYVPILSQMLRYPKSNELTAYVWRGIRDDFLIAFDHTDKEKKVTYMLKERYQGYLFDTLGTLPAYLSEIVGGKIQDMIIGELPVDTIDKMNAELDDAGFQIYMDELNRQWREFESTKSESE